MIDQGMDVDEMLEMIQTGFAKSHEVKKKSLAESMRTFEKAVMLRALDHHWKEHLGCYGPASDKVLICGLWPKKPVQEYKRESFSMFTELLETINIEIVQALCSVILSKLVTSKKKFLKRESKSESPRPSKKAPPPRSSFIKQPNKNLKGWKK